MSKAHRTLILMRHAKSSWAGNEIDHQRPLKGRGRRDAAVAGEWLAVSDLDVDLVLCSTALRTRETWERMTGAGARAREVRLEDGLYQAHPESVLATLHRLPAKAYAVLVLGHNPCIEELVHELGISSGQAWWTSTDRKYPTSAVSVLDFDGDWADLQAQTATLLHYEVPRAR